MFDQVVLACHADQALQLLADPTYKEQQLLNAFPYQRNRALLHSDERLMPKKRNAWASWNYLSDSTAGQRTPDTTVCENYLSVTYWMNKLQPMQTSQNLFVTLNPAIEPRKILRSFLYDHPVFTHCSLDTQQNFWDIQGENNTWFCGAWLGYGFHEDGLQSGLAVAEAMTDVKRPWELEFPNTRIYVTPRPKAARPRPMLEVVQ